MDGFPLIAAVKKENLKRVAMLTSKVILENKTSIPLQSLVLDQKGASQECEIKPGERMPLPFNSLNQMLMVTLKTSMSQKLDLRKITDFTEKKTFKIPLVCPKEHYNNLLLDVSPIKNVTLIRLRPALTILNLCPVPIEYTLKSRKYQDSNMIFRSKPLEIYRFNPHEEACLLMLTINDLYRLQIDLHEFIQSKEKNKKEKLKAVHVQKNNEARIYLDFYYDAVGETLYVYSKVNIFNETGLRFDIVSFDENSITNCRKVVESNDPTILFTTSKKHTTFMIYANQHTFAGMPGVQATKNSRCVFPKKINHHLNQTIIAGVDDKSFCEINFNITPSVVKLNDPLNLLTKTLTITPKFVFINNTAFKISLIQMNSNHTWSVQSGARLPLYWRSRNRLCSFQVEHPSIQ